MGCSFAWGLPSAWGLPFAWGLPSAWGVSPHGVLLRMKWARPIKRATGGSYGAATASLYVRRGVDIVAPKAPRLGKQ
ncbi:hypothetical protein [Schaalia suimastitidis]|uniref:hypothetical protein n=1 Tax=Schaalia suimastitidis TaxID=121163 RepID=UPI00103CF854|nr:hypothetical protein [Schaalia suimastitidis]